MSRSSGIEFNGIDPWGRRLDPSADLRRGHVPTRRTRGHPPVPLSRAMAIDQDLESAGWGAIFTPATRRAAKRALAPLLRLRQAEAQSGFRGDLLWTGRTSVGRWVRSHEAEGLPAYLLIVGDASAIPFELQYRLSRIRAVGRIAFPNAPEYRSFANALVRQERTRPGRKRRSIAVFSPRTPNDSATATIADDLAVPVARWAARRRGSAWIGRVATKVRLTDLIRRPPSVLLTTSHGFARLEDYYTFDDPVLRRLAQEALPWSPALARADNGALICQDWNGFETGGMIPRSVPTPAVYFAGSDVSPKARLDGLVAILVACFSGGTPRWATFGQPGRRRPQIATRSFLGRLPQCLLRQGAVAVLGHVEQAAAVTIPLPESVSRQRTFQEFIHRVLVGERIGSAMGQFEARVGYLAELARQAAEAARRQPSTAAKTRAATAGCAYEDARNFILIGDPAARIRRG